MNRIIKLSRMTRFEFPKLIDALHITHGVEIGVERGWFSSWLLDNSSLKELWSVDCYLSRGKKDKVSADLRLPTFGMRSRQCHMYSREGAELADKVDQTFGFIYIDAGHRASDVLEDIQSWMPLLERPGIIAGHDYIERGTKNVQVIPVVNKLQKQLKEPLYITAEDLASWFFILG
jgi:predicted O-methyltransferase YrrM